MAQVLQRAAQAAHCQKHNGRTGRRPRDLPFQKGSGSSRFGMAPSDLLVLFAAVS